MHRTGVLLVGVMVVGGLLMALHARAPFPPNPNVTYDQFLVDFEAGLVGHSAQWQDQLDVLDAGEPRAAVTPVGRDLISDLAVARSAGRAGIDYRRIPDDWLLMETPIVPAALTLAAFAVLLGVVRRNERLT